ncbi:hypothetical protein M885DRAFT_525803 [Pelagophyceae sp. CCMP2097]|nr:hypothetical protein M885DRAFT_525803 [Pelagophyceae sp. CCMP2097]
MARRRLPWWAALLCFLCGAAGESGDGYLFVSNRPDEAISAARRIRAVSPAANITLICDGASSSDVSAERVFDVVLSAEKVWPELKVHDSQGFRLQKLRGMAASPYSRTIYMDTDTYTCKSLDHVFRLFDDKVTDIACVHGGRGNHSGAAAGVLAFRRSLKACELWQSWLMHYRKVMKTTRREQPSFQKALQSISGLNLRKLPLSYNCRNARHCGSTSLKDGTLVDGCTVIHAHDFDRGLSDVAPSLPNSPPAKCAVRSGAHRIVGFTEPHPTSKFEPRLSFALAKLRLDNDFSICAVGSAPRPAEAVAACVSKTNKYAVVATGTFHWDVASYFDSQNEWRQKWPPLLFAAARHPVDRLQAGAAKHTSKVVDAVELCLEDGRNSDAKQDDLSVADALEIFKAAARTEDGVAEAIQHLQKAVDHRSKPSCFEAVAGMRDDGDVRWFCGKAERDCDLASAWEAARTKFAAVGVVDDELSLVQEMERTLPSHFLKLGPPQRPPMLPASTPPLCRRPLCRRPPAFPSRGRLIVTGEGGAAGVPATKPLGSLYSSPPPPKDDSVWRPETVEAFARTRVFRTRVFCTEASTP